MGKFEATINFYQGRLVIPTWFEKREKGLLFVPGRTSSNCDPLRCCSLIDIGMVKPSLPDRGGSYAS